MATPLGIRGPRSYADAYGLRRAAAWDLTGTAADTSGVQMNQLHFIINAKNGVPGPTLVEVSFDETDIRSVFNVIGHPGVVGLWLDSYTATGTVFTPPGLSNPLDNIAAYIPDPTLYVIPSPYLPGPYLDDL
jgi:hypothetical protein